MVTEIALQLDRPAKKAGGSFFVKGSKNMDAVVLLSGGMDSAVALYWAAKTFRSGSVYGLFINYNQRAFPHEMDAAYAVWQRCQVQYPNLIGELTHVAIPDWSDILISESSIQGSVPVDQYTNVAEAVAKTDSDKSYLPMRNALFTTIAAHHLLVHQPKGGHVVLGIRARADGSGGFPDCTNEFSESMSIALSQGAGVPVNVISPLNTFAPSREKTIRLAQGLNGCLDAVRVTVSCFEGTRCGRCLPCLRRKQAFEAVGIKDPAEKSHGQSDV